MSPKQYAAAVFVLILPVVWFVDRVVRDSHLSALRAEIAAEAEATARDLSDLLARESAAVNTLAAFFEVTRPDLDVTSRFETFAQPLIDSGESIRAVQLAPDSRIEFIYPMAGNEAALHLDLMADPERRRLLEPAIESGATVVQGPVELVQGGVGVLVRKPIYGEDGDFFGFAAILLDWEEITAATGIEGVDENLVTATRVRETGRIIAGDPEAFSDDPAMARLEVGHTSTIWEVALRPAGGWPDMAPATPYIWASGLLVAVLACLFTLSLARRPEVLRREREKALKELAFVEARYRATFDHAAVGVVITDAAGRILSANPAMHRIAEVGENDSLKGVLAPDLVHPDDRAVTLSWLERLKTEPKVESEVRLGRDRSRWVRVIVTRISGWKDDDLYVAIAEDITERRAAEQQLADSEARFRQLFEQAPIAIQREDYSEAVAEFDRLRRAGVTDIRAYLTSAPQHLEDILSRVRILDANPASARLQGHLVQQGGPLTLFDRLTDPARMSFLDTLEAVWMGRPSMEQSVETVKRDGSPLHLDVRWSAPIVAGAPDYSRMMVTISDITDLREAQQRLESLIESKDRFVASVAHELRTPLTAVVGFAQELEDELHLYSEREKEEFRQLIAFHSNELSNIIEDLLVWARHDIGEVRVTADRIDLGHSVRRSLIALDGLELEVEEPDGPVEAIADPVRINQIVRNLASNAIRYGGDRIAIRVRSVEEWASIDVADDGDELSETDAFRIFEPYARAEAGRAAPGSIGLGLTVSLALARLQGGDIFYIRDGGENVFRVLLPLARSDSLVAS